jgi:hypothetical protein
MNVHSDGALIQSAILLKEYGLIVADRAHLPAHPALMGGYLGLGNESTVVSKTLASLGSDVAPTVSETGAAQIVDYSTKVISATVVRKSIGRSRSDMLKFYDQTGLLKNPAAMALDAAMVRGNTIVSLVAAAAATATRDVGPSSGSALTWQKLIEAKQTLVNTGVSFADGELLAVLHPNQWSNLETAIIGTGLGDALTHTMEAYNIQYAKAIGYQGRYFGIDIFTSTRVPTANGGADSRGALVAPGGVAWAEGLIEPDADGFMDVLDGGRLAIERERDAARMSKAMYHNFLIGVALGDDDRVVTITSDR